MQSSLSVLSWIVPFVVPKKSSPYPSSSRLSPTLLSKEFIVLCLVFTSVIHSDLIFVDFYT